MYIFTVSFFGHREIERMTEIEKKIDELLHDIIVQHEYVEFLIGRNGDFDLIASSAIKRAISKYGCGNTSFILVLPYQISEYCDDEQSYLKYYDEVEICAESAKAHYKSAIDLRNKNLVDRSDLVLCCVQRKSGGAYKAVQYAKKQNRMIINIADEI